MAVETNLEIWLGSDHNVVVTIYNAALTAILDSTAWVVRFMVKTSLDDADSAALVTLDVGATLAVSGTYDADPDTNTQVWTASLSAAVTAALTAGSRFWELKRIDTGYNEPVAFGKVTFRRGVIRSVV